MSTQSQVSAKLGKLENVKLKDIWSHEASEFTPWLENNLDLLGEYLGFDLEIVQREAAVGSFSLDLLVHDVSNDRTVVIENQFNRTDHDHLGKLLTYAAGHSASVVIWVSEKLREEHRQALDWLNQRTDEETQFFGIEIELFKIGNSEPAPHFKLVAFPNDWVKVIKRERSSQEVSPRQEAYRQFFQELIDELREVHHFTHAQKAQPQSWYYFATGSALVNYGFSFVLDGKVRVELYLNREQKWNKNVFDQLFDQNESIETDLKETLSWERLDDKKASRIGVYRDGSIDDTEQLAEIKDWAIDRLLKFKEVFGPRLTELVN